MVTYATLDDLTSGGWVTTVPDNAEQLLRSASLLIARVTGDNLYNQTAPHNDEPRHDATLAQAAAWAAASIDPAAGVAGITPAVKEKDLGTGRIVYDGPTAAERATALNQLAPDAYSILYAAGLLIVDMPVWSDSPSPGVYVGELGHVNGFSWNSSNGYGYGYDQRLL